MGKAVVRAGVVGLLAAVSAGRAGAALIDLTNWTVVQYEFNDQPDAAWVLSNANHTATQTVNADGSYLRSDFTFADARISGTWRVNTNADDDFMGFVFGEQDPTHYYLFDWKKATQADPTFGTAQVGMTVKRVGRAAGSMAETDLWPTTGSANVTQLKHNSVPWVSFVDYEFTLEFHPGTFKIDVAQLGAGGARTALESWTVNDAAYASGHFGFYNDSQDSVVYNGFTVDFPEPAAAAPLGVLAALMARRSRRQSGGGGGTAGASR